jgi:hypothetical protein
LHYLNNDFTHSKQTAFFSLLEAHLKISGLVLQHDR